MERAVLRLYSRGIALPSEASVVMDSIDQQHSFVRDSLVYVAQKCETRGIDPEIVVQTIISVGVTLAVASCDTEDVARLLESMAASVREGDFTRDDA
jgi:hypothetical protein